MTASPAFTPFLEQHCLECHDADVKKGALDLSSLSTNAEDAAALKKWVRVFDRVAAGEMPPPKQKQPPAVATQKFLSMLGADLTQKYTLQRGTVLRRLNRQEYQNTLEDLLGITDSVTEALPEDGRAQGFDTIGEALSISGIQMQRYMEAAEVALHTVLVPSDRPETIKESYSLDSERNRKDTIGKHWLKRDDGALVVFNDGGFPSTQIPSLRVKTSGTYKLRITGYGYQVPQPVVFALIRGTFDFRSADFVTHSFHELPVDKPGTVEVTLHLKQGQGIKISPQGLHGPDGHSPIKDGPQNYPGEGLALLSVELEGPLLTEWPPRGQTLLVGGAKLRELPPEKPWMRQQRGYKPKIVVESPDPVADARKNFPAFVAAAFRRPVSSAEVEPFLKLFDAEFTESQDVVTSLRTAAVAVLCSPEFLFLHESEGKLNDHQLAVRLSYFLTRSTPDAELLKLAAAKQLTRPAVLRAQTERLLKSPGLDRFVADFTDGWLNLREIEFTTPDKQLYPEYDEVLLDSMLRETRSFFGELIRENLDVSNIIQSDFAMLNSRLATHYGVPGVTGLAMQKIKLAPASKRGGVLTQASVLKVSANGTNTSPVVRGVWVMDRILGLEPPPPPPG
ncbi:MAG: DUF1592 domain-containing protein, partial [Roseimicrobium sp.]